MLIPHSVNDPELRHRLSLHLARSVAPLLRVYAPKKRLAVSLWGIHFPHPVGLAAGADKDGMALKAWEQMGMGWVEFGTVTRWPQAGNDKPRVISLPQHQAVINSMGLPNRGVEALAQRLQRPHAQRCRQRMPIAVSIGSQTSRPVSYWLEDDAVCIRRLWGLCDLLVMNLSCPNVHGQPSEPDILNARLKNAILTRNELWERSRSKLPSSVKPAVLAKLSPDLSIQTQCQILQHSHIEGLIATNTTRLYNPHDYGYESLQGGLSGAPLFRKSLATVQALRQALPQHPIVGTGGITSPENAVAMIQAGASLVQLYTGMIFKGPRLMQAAAQAIHQYATSDQAASK